MRLLEILRLAIILLIRNWLVNNARVLFDLCFRKIQLTGSELVMFLIIAGSLKPSLKESLSLSLVIMLKLVQTAKLLG